MIRNETSVREVWIFFVTISFIRKKEKAEIEKGEGFSQ